MSEEKSPRKNKGGRPKGKGFFGVLKYDLKKEKGYILATNMSGQTPKELA